MATRAITAPVTNGVKQPPNVKVYIDRVDPNIHTGTIVVEN